MAGSLIRSYRSPSCSWLSKRVSGVSANMLSRPYTIQTVHSRHLMKSATNSVSPWTVCLKFWAAKTLPSGSRRLRKACVASASVPLSLFSRRFHSSKIRLRKCPAEVFLLCPPDPSAYCLSGQEASHLAKLPGFLQ